MMDETKRRTPFRRRHKLALQSVAFALMVTAPVVMFVAAQAEATGVALVGLAAMGGSMALAMWVS